MQQHDRRPAALVAHEARGPPGGEPLAGGAMDLDRFEGGIALAHLERRRMIALILSSRAGATLARSVPLTRSREARKEQA